MSTRDIRPFHETTVCEVCGRTLLRGERAETYVDGAERHTVCELCKTRAAQEGWVREGSLADHENLVVTRQRRGSLLARLLGRGGLSRGAQRSDDERGAEDDVGAQHQLERHGGKGNAGIVLSPPPPGANSSHPKPRGVRRSEPEPRGARRLQEPAARREPRHVHAVPTVDARKLAAAVELFNRSEHCRTVAGVARSLGAPGVCVLTVPGHAGLVRIVVAWELCWYRYELDLSDEDGAVRLCARGYELAELDAAERAFNAHADERGQLALDGLQ